MNNVILTGRLTRDPEVRHSQNGNEDRVVARYTLAVDRIYSKENQQAQERQDRRHLSKSDFETVLSWHTTRDSTEDLVMRNLRTEQQCTDQ